MSRSLDQCYKFGPFTLYPSEYRLLKDQNQPVRIGRKAFEVLRLLVQRREHLLTKAQILNEVWRNKREPEEGSVANCICVLRKVLDDNKEGTRYIETEPTLGYRFIAPVEELCDGARPWEERLATRGSSLKYVAPGYFLEKEERQLTAAGYSAEEAKHLTIDKLALEQEILMGAVMKAVLAYPLASQHILSSRAKHVIDVGVGTGELLVRLVPSVLERGGRYTGIDIAQNVMEYARQQLSVKGLESPKVAIRFGRATKLTQVFRPNSIWLAIWGKFGQHLSNDFDWQQGLTQITEILEPGGYFLLYEPLQDNNERYNEMLGGNPRLNEKSYIRTLQDYNEALNPMRVVKTRYCNFCYETYVVGLWQKPS